VTTARRERHRGSLFANRHAIALPDLVAELLRARGDASNSWRFTVLRVTTVRTVLYENIDRASTADLEAVFAIGGCTDVPAATVSLRNAEKWRTLARRCAGRHQGGLRCRDTRPDRRALSRSPARCSSPSWRSPT
jgi:hypothetical protein